MSAAVQLGREAGDIAARPRQARHEAGADGIVRHQDYDWEAAFHVETKIEFVAPK
jgi:hypothetical protein